MGDYITLRPAPSKAWSWTIQLRFQFVEGAEDKYFSYIFEKEGNMNWVLRFRNVDKIVAPPAFTPRETLENFVANPSVRQTNIGYDINLVTDDGRFHGKCSDELLGVESDGRLSICVHGLFDDPERSRLVGKVNPRRTFFSREDVRKLQALAKGLNTKISALWEAETVEIDVFDYQPESWPDCGFDAQTFLAKAQAILDRLQLSPPSS